MEIGLTAPARDTPDAYGIIGDSPGIRAVIAQIEAIARHRRTTLIVGPTGTGKEVVARALHDRGQPTGVPFVVVHCGALPDTLAEDELFGHTRGAFTGARDARSGLIRAANGGTLFLDEVDSLSPRVQAMLLRFLESNEYRSVGSDRVERVTAWVIAATNRDLTEAARLGEFRLDLLYRLEVMLISLPPLHARGDDVELLARHFLRELVGPRRSFTPEALRVLRSYSWPGNVRELKHCIERAALLTENERIGAADLGLARAPATPAAADPDGLPPRELEDGLWELVSRRGLSLAEAVTFCERTIIESALRAAGGNRTRAAERLHIHLRTIFKKLQRS
jgi:DNA-binding NtrC family response regulator